jgi:hypothetical protein
MMIGFFGFGVLDTRPWTCLWPDALHLLLELRNWVGRGWLTERLMLAVAPWKAFTIGVMLHRMNVLRKRKCERLTTRSMHTASRTEN